MKALSKSVRTILLCGILGAWVYQCQLYCIDEILSTANIKRHWHLSAYDVWPLGAILGVITGSALAAIRMQQPQAAARICIVGGSLAAACIIDAVTLLCWWFSGNPHYGVFWTTPETLLGLTPVFAFGLFWSLLLALWSRRLRRWPLTHPI